MGGRQGVQTNKESRHLAHILVLVGGRKFRLAVPEPGDQHPRLEMMRLRHRQTCRVKCPQQLELLAGEISMGRQVTRPVLTHHQPL